MSFLATATALLMTLFQGLDDTGTAVARPVGEAHYNEHTGSYYQIFEFYGKPPHTWAHARRMVKGYLLQGREGQLATIKSVDVHYFLVLNFLDMRTKPMWIGLYAECNETAELKWVDGSLLADQSFRGFGDGELRNISRTCRSRQSSGATLPIFYQPDEFGVRWRAGRDNSNNQYMMVEFPDPDKEGASDAGEAGQSGQSDEAGQGGDAASTGR
jgi:hypothetical protein